MIDGLDTEDVEEVETDDTEEVTGNAEEVETDVQEEATPAVPEASTESVEELEETVGTDDTQVIDESVEDVVIPEAEQTEYTPMLEAALQAEDEGVLALKLMDIEEYISGLHKTIDEAKVTAAELEARSKNLQKSLREVFSRRSELDVQQIEQEAEEPTTSIYDYMEENKYGY